LGCSIWLFARIPLLVAKIEADSATSFMFQGCVTKEETTWHTRWKREEKSRECVSGRYGKCRGWTR